MYLSVLCRPWYGTPSWKCTVVITYFNKFAMEYLILSENQLRNSTDSLAMHDVLLSTCCMIVKPSNSMVGHLQLNFCHYRSLQLGISQRPRQRWK